MEVRPGGQSTPWGRLDAKSRVHGMNKTLELSAVALAALAISACAQQKPVPASSGMGNPASVYCGEIGGQIRMEKTPQGEEGICVLPNGTEMEEWTLYRKDHPVK